MLFLVIGLALLALALYAVAVYNALAGGRNAVETAWGNIDIQLQRRFDLVPNLVSAVKGYMSHERETLDAVISARANAVSAEDRGSRIDAENALTASLGRLLAVSEAYPDLKAQENVSALMEELASTENRIGFARQHYNDQVLAQNNRIEMFPSSVLATAFRFEREKLFELGENAEARRAPVVSFD